MPTKDTTTKQVSLRKLSEPKFITITKKPANRTGFKVIRSDKAEPVQAERSDYPLLSILLPMEVGQQDAYDMLELFGLGDDYEVAAREDVEGWMLRRKDASDAETTQFNFGDGLIAQVESESLSATRADGEPGVVVTGLEIMNEYFPDLASVQDWLRGNDVSFKEGGIEVVDGGFIVTRHDVGKQVETKKVAVQDGVTAIIAQADRADIPSSIVSVVSEYAYGNYGWGQLDFSAALADKEFTETSWEAISTLGRVLEEIMFYSGFSLAERKALIERATSQFSAFMSSTMDMLPEATLLQIRSDINKRQELIMINLSDKSTTRSEKPKAAAEEKKPEVKKDEEATRSDDKGADTEEKKPEVTASADDKKAGEEAARSDEGTGEEPGTPEGEQAEGAKPEFVTRSELEEVVNSV
ncbi:MAG: hypothetical protein ACWGQW_14915, partial [bacterium]